MRTLRTLAEAAHGIARGRLGERVPVRGRDEFALLGSRVQRHGEPAAGAARGARGRARRGSATRSPASARRSPRRTTSEQLLRVIVEAAVEATGATGARLVADDGRIVETGDPDAGGERLELPLTAGRTTFGKLTPRRRRSFDDEQRMTAGSLASHAAIALENAGCTASSSGRRSSTASPASRTAASARTRSPRRSPAPSASARRSPSCSPTSTTSRP